MKVLLVGPMPPPHGGISVHVAGVQRELTQAGLRCEVLNTGGGSLGLPFGRSLLWHGLAGWSIEVHTNGHNRNSWLLALFCGSAGLRSGGSVLTLHSGMVPEYLEQSHWSRVVARLACRLFSRVVCVSEGIRASLLAAGVPANKLDVLPAYRAAERPAAHLDPVLRAWIDSHQPCCSTALFFRPEYGFPLLIAAIRQLRTNYPSIGCVVMGSGDGYTQAEIAVRDAGLQDSLLMMGDVEHETCLAVMARSAVFLRTTLQDGDSISIREALALGIPVIASDVGARPPEVTRFRAGDAADLVEKFRALVCVERVPDKVRVHAEA